VLGGVLLRLGRTTTPEGEKGGERNQEKRLQPSTREIEGTSKKNRIETEVLCSKERVFSRTVLASA